MAEDWDDAKTEIQVIEMSNNERIQALQRDGITLDPAASLSMRLQTLLDHYAPPGSVARNEIDLAFVQTVSNFIEQAEAESVKIKLLGGVKLQQP